MFKACIEKTNLASNSLQIELRHERDVSQSIDTVSNYELVDKCTLLISDNPRIITSS